jgi:hypothetical protein
MARPLLAIIAHPRDRDMLYRNWSLLSLPNWEILGCGTVDRKCEWPEKVMRLDTGKMGTKMTPAGSAIFGLVEQELTILKWFLDHREYDSVCIMEADNIFVRQPPEHPGNGIYAVTVLPNYSKPGLFSTPIYFSTPRWADREAAERLYYGGLELFRKGDHQHWISDRFMAHVCHRYRIQWMNFPAWSNSAFHWGARDAKSAWVRDARAAIQCGCYSLHSVKEQWELDAIQDLLPCASLPYVT